MDKRNVKYSLSSFVYETLSGFKFNLGGQLGGNEIFALLNSFRISVWRNTFKAFPDLKNINKAYLVLLFSQVLSDFINHSKPENFIRGWANIIVAIIVTNFLVRVLGKSGNAIVAYMAGSIISLILWGADTEGLSLSDMGFFKFKVVPVFNSILMIISWYWIRKSPGSRFNIVILFALYGLFNFAFDSRSNGMIFIIIALILSRRNLFRRMTYRKAIPVLIISIIFFQGLYSLYVSQVMAGKIGGEHAREQLSKTANPYNPVNLLLTGRSEVYIALIAIGDKPIWGHGSWAPDPTGKYTQIGYQLQGEEERFDSFLQNRSGEIIIPSHSVIFGAWMTSGIIGFFAIVYIVFLFLKRSFSLISDRYFQRSPFFPVFLFFLINGVWTFLFSPLPHIKQSLPVMIGFILVMYKRNILYAEETAFREKLKKRAIKTASYGY